MVSFEETIERACEDGSMGGAVVMARNKSGICSQLVSGLSCNSRTACLTPYVRFTQLWKSIWLNHKEAGCFDTAFSRALSTLSTFQIGPYRTSSGPMRKRGKEDDAKRVETASFH